MSGVVSGIGLAVSAGGALMGSMNASNAANAQTGALQSQEQLAQQQWNRYMTEFAPLENEMVSESEQPYTKQAGYLSAVGANNRMYGDLEANTAKKTAAMSPGGTGGTGMSTGMSDAQERARIQGNAGLASTWDTNQWNKMVNAASLGRGLTTNAMTGYGNAASGFGQQAGMYSNLMNQSAYGMGSGFSSFANSPYFTNMMNSMNANPASGTDMTGYNSGLYYY